jgi:leader peptidase (prepilin peptidase) / N-methyltransferase
MNPILLSFQAVTGLPEYLGYLLTFVFGAIIGSFLNVVIHRVPLEESVVFPNSACPKCKNAIKSYDNIPILSWLILGGKCRNCKNPISARYPAVELLTAVMFALVYWQIGFVWYLPVCLVFVAAMISLVFIDSEYMILPDVITYPLLFFALAVRLIFPLVYQADFFSDTKIFPLNVIDPSYPAWAVSLFGALIGGIIGGGSLWLVGEIWKRLRGVEAMGFGDVKMMFGVGALLGWQLTFLTIFLGALTGSLIGIFVMIKDRENGLQAKIPFGIFLGIGAVVSLLFGEKIIVWYFATFVPS